MSDACYRIDELETIAGLAPGDRALDHLHDCPRCRARLASYRSFLDPADVPAGADPTDAAARLSDVLEREILTGASATRRSAAAARSTRPSRLDRLFDAFLGPRWRPAFGAGAAFVVVVSAMTLLARDDREPELRLRGDRAGTDVVSIAEEPERMAGGRVRLTWRPVDGANRYELHLLDDDGTVHAIVDGGPDTLLVFQPTRVPDPPPSGAAVAWCVVAYRNRDEIARSRVGTFRMP